MRVDAAATHLTIRFRGYWPFAACVGYRYEHKEHLGGSILVRDDR
jgi:hypothetical protein